MVVKSQKSEVFADINKNRLFIVLRGSVRKEEIESLYTDIRFCVADLQPGFNVITDMTKSNIGYLSGASTFRRIASYLLDNNVGTVIRVTGKQSIIADQINKISQMVQGYKAVYVTSMEEAEQILQKA